MPNSAPAAQGWRPGRRKPRTCCRRPPPIRSRSTSPRRACLRKAGPSPLPCIGRCPANPSCIGTRCRPRSARTHAMSPASHRRLRTQRGVGLVEVMIGIVIAMLLVLVIYQIYEVSEGQKRTITAGSDAQQNASYGLYMLSRDMSMAGNGIASAAASLDGCALLRPIPVLIEAGATTADPDRITVLYGGSSSLSTPVQFRQTSTTDQPYVVPGPVAFSPNDVIVAVQGANCTLSTIDAGGVAVNPATGFATLTHTPVAGNRRRPIAPPTLPGQSGPGCIDGTSRVFRRSGDACAAHAEAASRQRSGKSAGQRRRQPEGPIRPRHQHPTALSTRGRTRPAACGRLRTCPRNRWPRCGRSARFASRSSRAAPNTKRIS